LAIVVLGICAPSSLSGFDALSRHSGTSLHSEAPPWTRLQGPNQWPAAFPDFKPTLLTYQDEITAFAIRVLRAFAGALSRLRLVDQRLAA
jgi:isopenicillin N synthase-like dioxygenase